MNHLIFGLAVFIFGIVIGGIGVASAGVGIGIPMMPLGAYLSYRGWRIYKHERDQKPADVPADSLEPLENTTIGKAGIGILLMLVGVGTSWMFIGIPIFLGGMWFIYKAFEVPIKRVLQKMPKA